METTNLLVARIHRDAEYLLLHHRPELPLDPGHWCLPARRLETGVAPPHPALCGFSSELAPGLQALLKDLGLDPGQIEAVREGPALDSPPWHPAPLRARLVDVRLSPEAPDGRPAAQALALDWRSRQAWRDGFATGGLLLNPLSRALLDDDETPAWPHWTHEEPVAGLRILPVRSNTLPPASHTNAFVFGAAPRLLVDPSPANDAAYVDLLRRLEREAPEAILLTHHHPDHHQQSTRLARELQLPIWCSADTMARIPSRFGAHYWDGVETRTVQAGEELTRWLDQPVRAHAVPGHDAGQLALAPDNRAWMIVGDLIQGIGTVVIAEPEGDMARYLDSLRWVIDQRPAVIIPSHGQAMGGTHRIEETLRHRLLREQQVLQMHRAGDDIETMLAKIYRDVDKRLWGLARLNIASHLRKLADEDRL